MLPVHKGLPLWRAVLVTLLAVAVLAHAEPAWAQARNPFSVGISEGGGQTSGLMGWVLAQQAAFERLLAGAVRATHADWRNGWRLALLSFAYGVFHAAGPGHGKAVVASYIIANERALKRGLLLALFAALLQGLVAVALVGIIAVILHQTALQMRMTAQMIETASFAAVAALGAWLVVRKGAALLAALRLAPALSGASLSVAGGFGTPSGFMCDACDDDSPTHVHGAACGHVHMPDPATLGGQTLDWREAAATVLAAGLRPCSGAILVLVFALAQDLFWVGVAATFAMALGTAITTGILASLAVFAKTIAVKWAGPSSPRSFLLVRTGEFLAALMVLALGLLLTIGFLQFA